ncbi:MAG TPA: glycoside hydrolase family 15 protein [Candidatus Saccharibacteria bacterium]|nr:glycoside hydrolase family 15 protein [Candidatus Saccharibacteria bacterium]
MARHIVLSNGELHVGLNVYGLVHDFYFPYVGLENHSAERSLHHRVGVWVDGMISWLDDADWTRTTVMADDALIGHMRVTNEKLGVLLEFDDCVDAKMSAFLRNIHVVNLHEESREIRLFMHQAFAIGDSRSNTDTAQYLPDSEAILHYRGRRAFIISGSTDESDAFDQHSIGIFGIEGREGTYRDADDGELQGSNVEHGRVDSTVRFSVTVKGHSSARVHYWIAAGTSTREALYIHKQIQEQGLGTRLHETHTWWQEWLKPARKISESLPKGRRHHFLQSALVVKSHIDKRGAIIASTDSEMLNYSRDAYAYTWPRDGAYALWPLIRCGYIDEPRRFFEFCRRGLHPSGYLAHKYQADGAIGSSWHPYVHEDESAPPIQEDETALVLFMFAQFYHLNPDKKLLSEFYDTFVKRMADFVASYIDETTGLPRPSYDLWEETYLTTTYTTATVHAGLIAAAELAEIMEDSDSAVKWRAASEDILQAAHKHLFSNERQAFYKGIMAKEHDITRNDTIDLSSFFGAFMYGLFSVESEELTKTYESILQVFGVTDDNLAVPRYENDNYQRKSPDIKGNYWHITTLWLAQYLIERGEVERAMKHVSWVESHMGPTGMLAEQIDPKTGESLSVSPLVWSHAEYMATLLDTVAEQPHET